MYVDRRTKGNNHMIKGCVECCYGMLLLLFLQSGWSGCFSLMGKDGNDDGIYKDDQYAKGWNKEPEELYW